MQSKRFDAFLSHHGVDTPSVEVIGRKLQDAAFRVWLDKWNLIPGEPWQEAIEEALKNSGACAVFVGPSGTGQWHDEEMRVALSQRVAAQAKEGKRFRVIPVLLPGAGPAQKENLSAFLVRADWVEFKTLDDDDALFRLKCGIRGVEPGASTGAGIVSAENPYRGLKFFDVNDSSIFFGREELKDRILDQFRGSDSAVPARLLALIGCSGSGKSSLARAGVIAAIRHDAIGNSSNWPIVVMRPGDDPFGNLALAVSELSGHSRTVEETLGLAAELRKNESALSLTARMMLGGGPDDRRFLLFIDQFEECFTLCKNVETRGAFIDALMRALNAASARITVLLTLRADYYGDCASYPEFATAISQSQVLVTPMTAEDLQAAIEKPAFQSGCDFEPGLVKTILKDIRDQPSCLPLLQYALRKMWDDRAGNKLTHETYNALGGVGGAIASEADKAYNKLLPEQRSLCRPIFARLVEPIEGQRYVRRRAPVSELVTSTTSKAAVRDVLDCLAGEDARLLVVEVDKRKGKDGGGYETERDYEVVEIAHEALLQSWPLLHGWLDEDREFQLWLKRLRENCEVWRNANRDESVLLRGVLLDEALKWRVAKAASLSEGESEYVQESVNLRAREEAEEADRQRRIQEAERLRFQAEQDRAEAERQRADEQAKRAERERELADEQRHRADEQAKAAKTWRRLVAGLAAALMLVLMAGGFAFWQSGQSRSRELAAVVVSNLGTSDKRGLLKTALAAVKASPTEEAVEALHRAVQAARRPAFQKHVTSVELAPGGPSILRDMPINAIAFSPDGKLAATAGDDNRVRLWDVDKRQEQSPELKADEHVLSVAFRPDGNLVAAGVADGNVCTWPTSGGSRTCKVIGDAVVGVEFLNDNDVIAAGRDGTVCRGPVSDPCRPGTSRKMPDHIERLAVSRKSGRAAVALVNGTVQLFSTASTADQSISLKHGDHKVTAVAFNPAGNALATASLDGTVKIWDVSNPSSRPVELSHGSDGVTALAFSPDGTYLATAGGSGTGKIWYARTGKPFCVLNGATDRLTAAAFATSFKSPTVTFGSADGTARIYQLDRTALVAEANSLLQELDELTRNTSR